MPRAFLSIDPTPPPAPPHPAVPALTAKSDTEQEPHDKTPLPPTSSPSDLTAPPRKSELLSKHDFQVIVFTESTSTCLSSCVLIE